MAGHKDPVVAEVKKIRRELSRRLMAAHRKGRLHEELLALEREGMRAYREAANGARNGHSRTRK
jgi:hypothetical protein